MEWKGRKHYQFEQWRNLVSMTCRKCGGSGWLWWHELEHYDGPASDPNNCYSDDTKYTCDLCGGIMITVVNPSWEWVGLSEDKMTGIVKHLETCGRTCYKSEDRITDDSADKFVRMICRRNHESVLEHECLTARIVCSRACSHQLVRHRIAAYSQESMRYCNYGKKSSLQVICPPSIGVPSGDYVPEYAYVHLTPLQNDWVKMICLCYDEYLREIDCGVKPEDARFVLPNATKTEVVTTFNLRMWRHVFKERALNKQAQWEIREVFGSIYEDLCWRLPSVFGDLEC